MPIFQLILSSIASLFLKWKHFFGNQILKSPGHRLMSRVETSSWVGRRRNIHKFRKGWRTVRRFTLDAQSSSTSSFGWRGGETWVVRGCHQVGLSPWHLYVPSKARERGPGAMRQRLAFYVLPFFAGSSACQLAAWSLSYYIEESRGSRPATY